MITVLSPAKKLDYDTEVCTEEFTIPEGLDRSALLINKLQKTSKKKLGELMDISKNLVELNAERYAKWTDDFFLANSNKPFWLLREMFIRV